MAAPQYNDVWLRVPGDADICAVATVYRSHRGYGKRRTAAPPVTLGGTACLTRQNGRWYTAARFVAHDATVCVTRQHGLWHTGAAPVAHDSKDWHSKWHTAARQEAYFT